MHRSLPTPPTRDGFGPWPLLVVLVATALTFSSTVGFPFMAWDDPRYVVQNALVEHPLGGGIVALLTTRALGYPQPVTILSYALNRLLFGGMAPWSFHLVNLILHLVNVALVAGVASSLGLSKRAAAMAAMVFALHPLVVEPVSWVTGRKDILASTLLLSGLAVLFRGGSEAPFPRATRWGVATLLAALAMGAKPSAAVAALLFWIVLRAARPLWPTRRLAVALTPNAVVGAIVLLAARAEVVDVHSRPIREAALDVIGAWALQIGHLLWPVELVTSYARLDGDPSVLAMVLGTSALLGIVFVLARADGRSPIYSGLAFALVAYAPVAGVLATNRWTADSYMYLPLAGFAIAGVGAVVRYVPERLARTSVILGGALGSVLAIDSFAHAANWRTPEGIWVAAMTRYPENPVPYTEFARTLDWEGRNAEATPAYLRLDDRFPDVDWSYNERALARLSAGDNSRAQTLLEAGVQHGDRPSTWTYWRLLLRARIAPSAADPAIVRAAFDIVFPDMGTMIRDPRERLRAAAVLREARLTDLAMRVEAVSDEATSPGVP